MAWMVLLAGVAISVVANALLKYSNGVEKVVPGVASFILFAIAIYLYGYAVKTLPIGVAYAVWSGVGILIVTFIGIIWFKESISYLGIFFMLMILTGCIGLNLITKG